MLFLKAAPVSTYTWGRSTKRSSWLRAIAASAIVCLAPALTIVWYISLTSFQGSLFAFLRAIDRDGFISVLRQYSPQFDLGATAAYIGWLFLQAVLYLYLPGKINTGQRTPAGYLLSYRTNGLAAWTVTHVTYLALWSLGILDPAFIPKNWGSLIVAMNMAGYLLSALSYIKAHIQPTHANDRKFSGKNRSLYNPYYSEF